MDFFITVELNGDFEHGNLGLRLLVPSKGFWDCDYSSQRSNVYVETPCYQAFHLIK